jgi:hemerythrin-like domain-containing protein
MLGSQSASRSSAYFLAGGAGLLLGLIANPLRKLAVQTPTLLKKRWDEALAAEHEMTLGLLEAMEATNQDETAKRTVLLAQLKHALGKHSFQEENTIYAMMREHGLMEPAQMLNEEHGEVKRMLFDLTEMERDDPQWTAKVCDLRAVLVRHMAEEENELFPKLRSSLSEEENEHLSVAMNKEGLKLA